jgi:hypothetical protein
MSATMINNSSNKKQNASPIVIGDITFDDHFFDDQKVIENTIAQAVEQEKQITPYHHRKIHVSEDDFWKEHESEEDNLTFFEDSKINQSIERAARLEANLFRRFSIGLYESDIMLLDKLVAQGKNAKLAHISKAQIIRESLRHFKLSWIADFLHKDH